ncbi:MAG: hypothetical protein ACI4MS_00310 [Candidatus Coproplasma sp.]
MNIKKLKLATGLVALLGVITTVVFAFISLPLASANAPEGGNWNLAGLALVYIVFIIIFCVIAFLQLVYSLYYIFAKPKVRSFFVVSCVYSVIDIIDCVLMIYLAVTFTSIIGGALFPIITTLCMLPVVATIVLKIICTAKFKPEEKKEESDGEEAQSDEKNGEQTAENADEVTNG